MTYGFCQCGCGGKTNPHPKTDNAIGAARGEPRRYLLGHHPQYARKIAPERFAALYQKNESGCWIWCGSKDSHGYGVFTVSRKNKLRIKIAVHRFAYLQAHPGVSLDSSDFICHHCDNPPCVNPEHLYLGDHAANMRDMKERGRSQNYNSKKTLCIRGHPLAGDNLYVTPAGKRECRICCRAAQKAWLEKRAAACAS